MIRARLRFVKITSNDCPVWNPLFQQVAQQSGFDQAVQQWRGILDPEMKSLPPPAVDTEPPFDRPTEQQQAAQAAAQVEEDDEDLKGDLQRAKIQKGSTPTTRRKQDPGSLLDNDGLDKLTIGGKDGETAAPSERESKQAAGLAQILLAYPGRLQRVCFYPGWPL